ncbi:MAG: 4Fe-4S binding protein [Muribaculaceae bacterium]|nr:4Fe-4S binding protein [Muribaculaceae bacterium]
MPITAVLAPIDSSKCVGCGECIEPCPRHSIATNQRKRTATVQAD